jgi:hypothetical protein
MAGLVSRDAPFSTSASVGNGPEVAFGSLSSNGGFVRTAVVGLCRSECQLRAQSGPRVRARHQSVRADSGHSLRVHSESKKISKAAIHGAEVRLKPSDDCSEPVVDIHQPIIVKLLGQ